MQQCKVVTNGKRVGQSAASVEQIEFLRALVGELGAARAAKRAGLNQLTMMRVIAGLPVLRGTLALVDAALSKEEPQEPSYGV